MGAQGSQALLSFRGEVDWGKLDPGEFTGVNFTSEDMTLAIENQVSNNIRPDRQTADLVQVGAECSGGFETEFQADNIDGLLPGFLWDVDWLPGPTSETGATITAEGTPGTGGTMTVADEAIYLVGMTLRISAPSLNEGIHTIKEVAVGLVTFHDPMVDESADLVFTGESIINGVTKHSFSIERVNTDIQQYFLYLGMVPNTLTMTIESGSPITANLGFVGKNETLSQSESGASYTDAPLTPIMNAISSVGQVGIDGAPLAACLLQKIDFTLDNQATGKTGIGVLGFCDVDGKSISLTGSIAMYFNDQTYYEKYLNSESFSVQFDLEDPLGNAYSIQLPECKFDSATANVTGKDDDVMVEGTFVAIVDPVYGFTIKITKM